MGEVAQPRFEKSLGLLTSKFVSLLQKSKGGILDLKVVSGVQGAWKPGFKRGVLWAGRRYSGGAAEAAHLRHHQRAGGHRPDREEEQKQHPVEVSIRAGLRRILSVGFRPYAACKPGDDSPSGGFTEKIARLKQELARLDEYEQELDMQKVWVKQSIRNTAEDSPEFLYLTLEDLAQCYDEHQTVIAARAPLETHVALAVSAVWVPRAMLTRAVRL